MSRCDAATDDNDSMTVTYTIRPIRPSDDAPMAALIRRCLEDAGLDRPGTAYCDPQLDRLAEYYAGLDRPGRYWVAVEHDSDDTHESVVGGVGIAAWTGTDDDTCELQKLYVAANHRRLGLGRRLLEIALAFAEQHYQRCYLETHSSLTAACELYRTCGFTFRNAPLAGSEHSAMDMWAVKKLTAR